MPIDTRAISLDRSGTKYSLILRAADAGRHKVNLQVKAVGEELTERIAIREARMNGRRVAIGETGAIEGVVMKKGDSTILEVELDEPRRVSLEVTANEA